AEIEGIARTGGVARADLERIAAAERIEIREPDRLPAAAPYPAFRRVQESLDVLGHRHLADFVFEGRVTGPIALLGGFRAAGADLRLDARAVADAGERWARRSRDTTSTHAPTVLAALRAGADLSELALYDVAERLRERLRQRASERALLQYAVDDLRIDPGDARRIVFAVVRETGHAGGLAGRLRALLDAGEVFAAAELADAAGVPRTAGNASASEEEILAAEARHRLDTALRLRESAIAERDPDRAHRMLDDALRLVRDLPGAGAPRRRLPPRPVPWVRADVDGAAVRLSWEPSPTTSGEIVHHVVRRAGRPPRDVRDGVPIGGPLDERPPVNVPLY